MEFTKGEWKVAGDVNTSLWITGNDDEGCVVAKIQLKIYDERLDWQEAQANAQLIASAPDLYEALKALVTWLDDDTKLVGNLYEVRSKVYKAIAKAEGKEHKSG